MQTDHFVFFPQTDPIEYVENICENMQLFPKEDFLTGDQLMFEYKPEVSSITDTIDLQGTASESWTHHMPDVLFTAEQNTAGLYVAFF